MYIYLLVILVILFLLIVFSETKYGRGIMDFFRFFVEGQKYTFTMKELVLLWKMTNIAGLDDKTRVFWSVPALDESIRLVIIHIKNASEIDKINLNGLLSKLYDFRTKVELESVRKKRGLESTLEIAVGQVCVLLFQNNKKLYGQVIDNIKQGLKIKLLGDAVESFKAMNISTGVVSVYFWRKEDSGYFFKNDIKSYFYNNNDFVLTISHTKDIIRTQKRKSVRAECDFKGLFFPIQADVVANTIPELSGGVKCIIKDISEDGALIYIKGKCKKNIKIKLQFELYKQEVVMFGEVIRFIYNEGNNTSKVHFNCEKINPETRNLILSYVYKTAADSDVNVNDEIFDGSSFMEEE